MTMTATAPFPLHWTPEQITDAVPLRLFELDLFADAARAGCAANRPVPRTWRSGYLRRSALPGLFRVHG